MTYLRLNHLIITVSECKSAWKSLKDAINYRRRHKPGKSGKGGPEGDEEDDDPDANTQMSLEAWTFYESLKFLVDTKPTRKTISSIVVDDEDDAKDQENVCNNTPSSDDVEFEALPTTPALPEQKFKRPASNYDYMSCKRNKENTDNTDTKVIATGIAELVQLRKQATASTTQVKPLKYESMYANLDRMLAKLPSNVVEDLNMQFVSLAYGEVKKYEHHDIINTT
ncbi:uncharacterized protein LOC118437316 [Folsomia candida]|uniref:uncharacterized protein LOC118436917 n=1 Tax=Folsomia candida TaxID=158441 RepID=UPI001604AFCF|nr:uncharacterized protein LOC118436917 [Folsomia candida]XP_035712151.1 uncharacterized protein LOC118437316 [Folsomia candida]